MFLILKKVVQLQEVAPCNFVSVTKAFVKRCHAFFLVSSALFLNVNVISKLE